MASRQVPVAGETTETEEMAASAEDNLR
jgi:hypothetical protein